MSPNPMEILGERRFLSLADSELRIEPKSDDAPERLVGYAARFNVLSVNLGGFRERIRPGAFTKVLDGRPDVRALDNHEVWRILGRTRSKTLTLREDDRGLLSRITPPDTSVGRDVLASVRRGDIDGMSFWFSVEDDDWHLEGGENVRDIITVRNLYDVSPCTFPAYPDTDCAVRGLAIAGGRLGADLAGALVRAEHKLELTPDDVAVLRTARDTLEALIPKEETTARDALAARLETVDV